MDDGGRVDPTKLKIPALVQYVTTHGTWVERNELWHLLSERVVRIALRLADEQRANRDAQRTLQAEAVSNLPPDFLGQQWRARQAENLAPVLKPATQRES